MAAGIVVGIRQTGLTPTELVDLTLMQTSLSGIQRMIKEKGKKKVISIMCWQECLVELRGQVRICRLASDEGNSSSSNHLLQPIWRWLHWMYNMLHVKAGFHWQKTRTHSCEMLIKAQCYICTGLTIFDNRKKKTSSALISISAATFR